MNKKEIIDKIGVHENINDGMCELWQYTEIGLKRLKKDKLLKILEELDGFNQD